MRFVHRVARILVLSLGSSSSLPPRADKQKVQQSATHPALGGPAWTYSSHRRYPFAYRSKTCLRRSTDVDLAIYVLLIVVDGSRASQLSCHVCVSWWPLSSYFWNRRVRQGSCSTFRLTTWILIVTSEHLDSPAGASHMRRAAGSLFSDHSISEWSIVYVLTTEAEADLLGCLSVSYDSAIRYQ